MKKETRRCSICKEDIELSEYYRRKSRDSYVSACKPCYRSAQNKRHSQFSKDQVERKVHLGRVWSRENPEKVLSSRLKSRYKITLDEYTEIFNEQNGLCPICLVQLVHGSEHIERDDPSWVNKGMVDHCHDSGEVRGLLCHCCNTGIGQLKEDAKIMSNAIDYINKHSHLKK